MGGLFFCEQLNQCLYAAGGLVMFYIGNEKSLGRQMLLVVFHRRAMQDNFLLVKAVLCKE